MIQFVEFAAVFASAVYGVLLARRKELDFVGVFAVAFIVSFGGGTVRDLVLDRHPMFWIQEDHYPIVVFIVALLGSVQPRVPRAIRRLLPLADALGLAFFSLAGVDYALAADTSFFNASLLGVITGCFGGVIADIVLNEVPSLFRSAPLYATCSFLGCWAYLLLRWRAVDSNLAIGAGVSLIIGLRYLAVRFDVRFPNLSEARE